MIEIDSNSERSQGGAFEINNRSKLNHTKSVYYLGPADLKYKHKRNCQSETPNNEKGTGSKFQVQMEGGHNEQ